MDFGYVINQDGREKTEKKSAIINNIHVENIENIKLGRGIQQMHKLFLKKKNRKEETKRERDNYSGLGIGVLCVVVN